MASKYVDDLRDIANSLSAEGWDRRARICNESADRMERMEDLIVKMSLLQKEYP